jgi:hypothetical protein
MDLMSTQRGVRNSIAIWIACHARSTLPLYLYGFRKLICHEPTETLSTLLG